MMILCNPKGLAQVVKALDFGGMSKVQITMGVNNSLELHSWQKPDLIDPCEAALPWRRGGLRIIKKKSCVLILSPFNTTFVTY